MFSWAQAAWELPLRFKYDLFVEWQTFRFKYILINTGDKNGPATLGLAPTTSNLRKKNVATYAHVLNETYNLIVKFFRSRESHKVSKPLMQRHVFLRYPFPAKQGCEYPLHSAQILCASQEAKVEMLWIKFHRHFAEKPRFVVVNFVSSWTLHSVLFLMLNYA